MLVSVQKHLGILLDTRLAFHNHIKEIIKKTTKNIGPLRKLQNILPRSALITIYKALIRPILDYSDIAYDKVCNNSFHKKLESIQYNAWLALSGAIRQTSKDKMYQELSFESLQHRCWCRRICSFYNPEVIKRLTRICPGLSHLRYYKFKYNFKIPSTLCVIVDKVKNVRCTFSASIYLLKVNNRNTRTSCEIFSKLTIKTPERRH